MKDRKETWNDVAGSRPTLCASETTDRPTVFIRTKEINAINPMKHRMCKIFGVQRREDDQV